MVPCTVYSKNTHMKWRGHSRRFLWKAPCDADIFYNCLLWVIFSLTQSSCLGGGGGKLLVVTRPPSVSVSKQNTNKTINFWHCKRQMFLFHSQTALQKLFMYAHSYAVYYIAAEGAANRKPRKFLSSNENFCAYRWEHWMADLAILIYCTVDSFEVLSPMLFRYFHILIYPWNQADEWNLINKIIKNVVPPNMYWIVCVLAALRIFRLLSPNNCGPAR